MWYLRHYLIKQNHCFHSIRFFNFYCFILPLLFQCFNFRWMANVFKLFLRKVTRSVQILAQTQHYLKYPQKIMQSMNILQHVILYLYVVLRRHQRESEYQKVPVSVVEDKLSFDWEKMLDWVERRLGWSSNLVRYEQTNIVFKPNVYWAQSNTILMLNSNS